MHYLGGKARIAKAIGEFINQYMHNHKISTYCEPFVGAGWVLTQVDQDCIKCASDAHEDLILLWQAIQNGWEPPDVVTKEEYQELKEAAPSALRGFVGFGCSYSGKWFGGYASDNKGRNYAKNAKNSLMAKRTAVKDVAFSRQSYSQLCVERCLVYCDPPYANTTGYKGVAKFNHEAFWEWARRESARNVVLVSEYQAPDDFVSILDIPTKTDMHCSSQGRLERLFVYEGLI